MSERTQQAMADFFDDWSEGYVERFTSGVLREHLTRRRMEHLRALARPDQLYVEVGCGTGASMSHMPCRTFGIDIAPGMLHRAHANGLRVALASGTEIPLRDGAADIVSAQLVLHHVNFYLGEDGVRWVIREMIRVAKPGGVVSILEANPYNPYWYYFMRRHGEDNATLIRPARLRQLLGVASGSRPDIIRLGFLPEWTPAPLLRPAALMEPMLERSPLGHLAGNYIAVCRVPT